MAKTIQYRALAFVALGLALPGCATRPALQPAPAPIPPYLATAQPHLQKFSLDTPVERIAADRRGKAILERDLPGLMTSHSYLLFDDMGLAEIASLSSGQLTQTKLDTVEADLSELSRQSR